MRTKETNAEITSIPLEDLAEAVVILRWLLTEEVNP